MWSSKQIYSPKIRKVWEKLHVGIRELQLYLIYLKEAVFVSENALENKLNSCDVFRLREASVEVNAEG